MSVLNSRSPRWARLTLATLASAVGAAVLSSCASLQPSTPEEQVARRAEARWQAMIKGDLREAYGFHNPAGRAVVPYERWRGSISGRATAWKAAKVAAVQCPSAEKCVATVTVTHEPLLWRNSLGSIDSSLEETWLSEGGQWWLLLQP